MGINTKSFSNELMKDEMNLYNTTPLKVMT